MSNNLIAGFTQHDESRGSRGTMFPFVDILQQGAAYTSFGFEPFTPNNELRYNTFQLQNKFTMYAQRSTRSRSVAASSVTSRRTSSSRARRVSTSTTRWPTSTRTPTTIWPIRTGRPRRCTLRRFQVRWNNIPGQEIPLQPLEVFYMGVYAQDDWRVRQQPQGQSRAAIRRAVLR